jgi:integration host factor beta subunit
VTKSELVATISEKRNDLSKKDIEQVVNTIFKSMKDALIRGERIEIRGFGSFTVKDRDARIGRNPKIGTPVDIPAKRIPFFTVGKELRERVNQEL